MDITFLGHSGFHLKVAHTQGEGMLELLIDPFLTGNPLAKQSADDLNADYILLTHAHGDHYGDTESIAKRCDATVVSNFEIANYVQARELKAHPMSTGGSWNFSFGRVTWTLAFHASSFPDGSYGGMPMGLMLQAEGKCIYHAGDTALFSDMRLIGDKGIDLAFVPIGDNFTMGIDDAVAAVKLLRPQKVVPIHYNTFPYIEVDVQEFADKVDCECVVLEPSQSLNL